MDTCCLTAIFQLDPDKPVTERLQSGFILLELRMMEVLVTIGAVGRAKLQPNRHHKQTNTRMPFLSHQQRQSNEGKYAVHINTVLNKLCGRPPQYAPPPAS